MVLFLIFYFHCTLLPPSDHSKSVYGVWIDNLPSEVGTCPETRHVPAVGHIQVLNRSMATWPGCKCLAKPERLSEQSLSPHRSLALGQEIMRLLFSSIRHCNVPLPMLRSPRETKGYLQAIEVGGTPSCRTLVKLFASPTASCSQFFTISLRPFIFSNTTFF